MNSLPSPSDEDERSLASPTPSRRGRGSSRPPRVGMGLSSRVLLGLVSITAIGLLLSSGAGLWMQHRAMESRIDTSLSQEVQELRTLATGVDP